MAKTVLIFFFLFLPKEEKGEKESKGKSESEDEDMPRSFQKKEKNVLAHIFQKQSEVINHSTFWKFKKLSYLCNDLQTIGRIYLP